MKARYGFVSDAAVKFITDHSLIDYPITIEKLRERTGIKIEPSWAVARRMGVDHGFLIDNILCGADAKAWHTKCGNVIVYSSMVTSGARTRWTVAHEIGHIVCGHLGRDEESWMEIEADHFAGCIIAPMEVVDRLQPMLKIDIEQTFGLSRQAASVTSIKYQRWKNKGFTPKSDITLGAYIDIHGIKSENKKSYARAVRCLDTAIQTTISYNTTNGM